LHPFFLAERTAFWATKLTSEFLAEWAAIKSAKFTSFHNSLDATFWTA
jgi:hypothetical protein